LERLIEIRPLPIDLEADARLMMPTMKLRQGTAPASHRFGRRHARAGLFTFQGRRSPWLRQDTGSPRRGQGAAGAR
jgi:hypothetical protein